MTKFAVTPLSVPECDRSECGDQCRDAPRDQQPDDSAERAKNSRLNQKLHQDLSPRGTHRFSESDFECSLSHAYQHDVHHYNPADNERDQSDRDHDLRDGACELVDLIVQFLNVHETEVILFLSVETMLESHRHACILNRSMEIFPVATPAVNLETVAAEDLKVGGDGNVDVTVHRVAEKRAALFFNADYAHRQPADFKCLSNRILIREKLVFNICAEDDHESRTFHFIVSDVAA